jgi:hypothetical protein
MHRITYELQLHYDQLWDNKFEQLLKFREMYNTVDAPNRHGNLKYPQWERTLGSWVATQRQVYKNGKLADWRYSKLVSVDFEFEPFESLFEEHFADLLKYKEKHGHVLVPQDCTEYPTIGAWVSHLRCKPVRDDRKERLNAIGFVWNTIDEYWQNMFRELVEFKKIHGHFKVSEKRKGYEKLGTWTVRMRKAKRYGKGQNLSDEQIKLLDSIGFDWEPIEADWNRNFIKLLEFVNKYNHCLVPIRRCEIEGLGWWVYWLRKNKQKLSNEQTEQLDSVGFERNSDIAYRKRNNIKGINNL